jgi:predicted Zn-dependent peptidase
MDHRLTTLGNGLRVISETMPAVRSVAVGCWVDTGSRDEAAAEAGCSHFLEHLLFKGSERLTAQDIAKAFDAVGARSNAFTSKEYTCFWAQLRDDDLPMGMDLLAEMLLRPAFRAEDIESEANVVLEEINMNEDDPADVAHDQFARALWGDHALALPVLGTKESIAGMSREAIAGYWGRRYQPPSVVVAAAGHVEHERVVELAEHHLGGWRGDGVGHEFREPAVVPRVEVKTRETEQAHLVFGGEALTRGDERRFAFGLLNHILGAGMSSRLFREIREDRGLAYAVYSFRMPFADSGAYGIYVGTTPRQSAQVLELIRVGLAGLAAEGVTADELERAKGNLKGSLALSMEETNSRMIRLGRHELTEVRHLSLDETVAAIEGVTRDEVHEVALEVFSSPRVLGAVGPFGVSDLEAFVQ